MPNNSFAVVIGVLIVRMIDRGVESRDNQLPISTAGNNFQYPTLFTIIAVAVP